MEAGDNRSRSEDARRPKAKPRRKVADRNAGADQAWRAFPRLLPGNYCSGISLLIWAIANVRSNALGAFLNDANLLEFRVLVSAPKAKVNLSAKLYRAKAFGLEGVVWATAFTTALGVDGSTCEKLAAQR